MGDVQEALQIVAAVLAKQLWNMLPVLWRLSPMEVVGQTVVPVGMFAGEPRQLMAFNFFKYVALQRE